ncbi:hypothetical protein VPH35_095722 [Triticum aestivum]
MDPVRSAELMAQLKELKVELKEKSLPGAKVTNGVPPEIRAFLAEVAKKQRAALQTQCESQKEKLKFNRMLEDHKKGLYPNCEDGNTKLVREAYSNREPPILRLNSRHRQDPCASPPVGSDRGGGKLK